MKTHIALLALALAALVQPAAAQDTGCGSYPVIPVKVVSVFEEPEYDLGKSIDTLQEIAAATKDKIPGDHTSYALGLTTYTPLINFKATIVDGDGTGTPCVMIKDVFASVGYQNIKVYVAKEFPQGSCEFDAIVEHEVKHLKVNQEVLEEYVEKIRQELVNQMPVIGVAQQENLSYAEYTLRKQINEIVSTLLKEMSQENGRRQMEVDSKQEYERVAELCNGGIQTVMREHAKAAEAAAQAPAP